MQITSTTTLTPEQKTAALQLQDRVHAVDHTYKQIYLSNQLNTEKAMATFFMATVDGRLVGFLMNYADGDASEAAELSVVVDPEYRRQGIATKLIAAVRTELARFNYGRVEFVTERAFLDAQPEFLHRTRLVEEEGTEFQLSCPGDTNADYKLPDGFQLRQMTAGDLPVLVGEKVTGFDDTDTAEARRYLEASLADPNIRQYVLVNTAGTILGTSSVDVADVYYFYGLLVTAAERGRGYSKMLVRAIMADLARGEQKTMRLGVEAGNAVARHVYQQAGFVTETEIVYLEEKAAQRV
ncbi:GNAT family N-acetyltransferase [Lacticaseibacillus hulanensis]|uniref:GNAT family N-acetyltransferase n=1 Tax=Lacticaseibacillus hulanensis TaxID=2493111 RepID=UPI000FDC47B3|nr:GNAT family N-acetyltransferase [Lacticaseibacillus hulanensis]